MEPNRVLLFVLPDVLDAFSQFFLFLPSSLLIVRAALLG